MLRPLLTLRRLVDPNRLVVRSRRLTTLQISRSVGDYLGARGSVASGGRSLEGILGNWRKKQKERRDSSRSHDSLTRCLYHVLEAARLQKLSSSQLTQNRHFQRFWDHLRSEVPSMSANSAVMCLYNCAQYRYDEDLALFSTLIDVCSKKVEAIPTKAYGILLWSLCKLEIYQENKALAMDVARLFHSELLSDRQIKPQSFANVLWALATTSTWPHYITDGVTDYVSSRAEEFDFHSLSIVLWSLTSAQLPLSDAFLEAAGARATVFLQSQVHAISLIHCCWAFGSAAYFHQSFFSALTDRLLSEPVDSSFFTPRLLASGAWACARTGYYHPGLLDRIAHVALANIHRFNSQDLGNLAYAYGQLNHSSDKLLLTISDIISSEKMSSNEQACANVASACLIHKLYPEALLRRLMSSERVSGICKTTICI